MPTPYALSSDLVSAWPAKSLAIATYLDDTLASKSDTAPAINAQTGTTYTFVLADATAGKTITASNAAASTYTVPPQSSVTFVAGALLRVTNLGAGVVTFAGGVGVTVTNTAGTLAQYQTATLVRTGSDAWTVIAGSASGLTLVATATASASSAVSINNCFTSLYDNYLVQVSATASGSLGGRLRLRVGGVDASGNDYRTKGINVDGSASVVGAYSLQSTAFVGAFYATRTATRIDIFSPFAATPTQIASNCSAETAWFDESNNHSLSTSYDGFTLYPTSGTFTTPTNGIRVYGYKNS